jgi:hypothetical protein
MSIKHYPHLQALGVKVRNLSIGYSTDDYFVLADELEGVLEQAPTFYGHDSLEFFQKFQGQATHTAKLLCVQPIVRESEERQLLRKILKACSDGYMGASRTDTRKLLEQARALLGLEDIRKKRGE